MFDKINRERALPKLLKGLGIASFIGAFALAVIFAVMQFPSVQAKYEQYLVILSDFENTVAALDNKWLIIIVILLLYVLRSLSAVVPYAVIYITSAMVFRPTVSFMLNFVGMAFTAAFRYYTGIQMGEGYLNHVLNRNPIIARIFEVDGKMNPIVLIALRIVPIFPYNTISQLYGTFEYPFVKYMIISMVTLLPRLISYSFIGNNVYDPFSTAFYMPLIVLLLITGGSFFFLRAVIMFKYQYNQNRKGSETDE